VRNVITRPQTAALAGADQLNLAPLAYMPPANHWLRTWYGFFQYLACYKDCDGGIETTQNSVGTSLVTLLDAEPLARGVEITNTGEDFPANIYEAGVLVGIAQAGRTLELPLNGLLEITAKTLANSTSLTATRYLRCACGDTFTYSGYSDEPVGAFLL
jgi:hypothetical protein